jgi:sodium-dependent dicarboxylate transporter 2/3/5
MEPAGIPANAPQRPLVASVAALAAGPLAGLVVTLLMPDRFAGEGGAPVEFALAGRATFGLLVWMAIWWVTEAIDVSATSLLPLVVLPLVTVAEHGSAGAAMTAAAAPYANQYVFLFLGGFVLALSMERWGLHRRIALTILNVVGSGRRGMVGGFMIATAMISMWVSNTATAVMMLPIAMSVIALVDQRQREAPEAARRSPNFAICLLLGVAYASSIGGVATLIGTPPNTILASFVDREYGAPITFARWLWVGVPVVVLFLPIAWLLLTRVLYPIPAAPIPGGRALVRAELAALGPMKAGEWVTFVTFLLAAIAWMVAPQLARITIAGHAPLAGLSDAGIAMIAAMVLLVCPLDLRRRVFVMDWDTTRRVPWGILLLFGGGLSLAEAIQAHGVAEFMGHQASVLGGLPEPLIVIAVTAGMIFLTEMASNTAITATMLPILAALAPALGVDPFLLLVPATIAASLAFMMPVGTPPNAIVFGTGRVTMRQMCRAGIWLNLVGVGLISGLAYAVVLRALR